MNKTRIDFPGYMERCQGFTIPVNKCFYVVSFDDLVYYDLNTGEVTELDDWEIDDKKSVVLINNQEIPFIGLWGGNPILFRDGVGSLSLNNSEVTLINEDGTEKKWQFENFSGDWEKVTFDTEIDGFLFGTPYDFDYVYISIK